MDIELTGSQTLLCNPIVSRASQNIFVQHQYFLLNFGEKLEWLQLFKQYLHKYIIISVLENFIVDAVIAASNDPSTVIDTETVTVIVDQVIRDVLLSVKTANLVIDYVLLLPS